MVDKKKNIFIKYESDKKFWKFSNKLAIRKGMWKGVIPGLGKRMELYNLELDIGEANNLAMKNPEKVRELKALIKTL